MPAKDLTYVVRLVLDRSLEPLGGSVTIYEDEDVTYAVHPLIGPFSTPQEALEALVGTLDVQPQLW